MTTKNELQARIVELEAERDCYAKNNVELAEVLANTYAKSSAAEATLAKIGELPRETVFFYDQEETPGGQLIRVETLAVMIRAADLDALLAGRKPAEPPKQGTVYCEICGLPAPPDAE